MKANKQNLLQLGAAYSIFKRAGLLLLLILIHFSSKTYAQDKHIEENVDAPITFDEVSVLVRVSGLNEFYVNAIYTSDDLLYVSVEELFNALAIPCVVGDKGESISGFIGDKREPYVVDYKRQQVSAGGKTYSFKRGLILDKGTLYMETSLFVGTFRMAMNFSFRTLTLVVAPSFELPFIKQQRIEALRKNVEKVKGIEVPDTVVARKYHFFKPGMLDWSVSSYQKWKGATDNRFGLGLGVELLYGEADISVNYFDKYKFDDRNLFYLWRWVDNSRAAIRQAQVGRISNQTIAFISSPIIGGSIRNTPTTIRKAKGFYTINEVGEPNWTVELYINNVLVDYTKTDASGAYTFKVPMVYGYTTLKLRFYGPLGEERTEERTMNVPYTVMPKGEFEYGLSGGILQDSTNSRYGRAEFNYGLNRFITVGGGLEYLSSIPNGAYIPFAKATIQPFSKMVLSGEYDHGVKTRGLLDFYFWKDASLELDYAKYVDGQLATRFNAPEERKAKLSVPFRIINLMFLSRFDFTQLVYKPFSFYQTNAMFSLYYRQLSANSSTQLNWTDGNPAYVTSNLSLSYRLRNGFIVRPSAYGNLTDGKLISCRVDLEKSIPRGYLSASYERYVAFKDNFFNLSIKYDLSFARTNLSVSRSGGYYFTSQSAQGSLAFGGGNGYVYASNNPSVSKGGIAIYPFLDLNQNGVFDKSEHMVKLASVRVPGGKIISSKKDSIVRVADLSAFVSYMVELNDIELENIAWRFKHKKYQILIDPNQFKRVYVPIIVVGEANGVVSLNSSNTLKGLGRILVKIYRKGGGKPVAEMLSESDGYISYIGLAQGDYVACVDSTQLQRLDYTSTPKYIPFTIKSVEDGDVVSGLNFILNGNRNEGDSGKDTASVKTTPLGSNTANGKKEAVPIKVEQENPIEASSSNGNKEGLANPTLQKMVGFNSPYTVVLGNQNFQKCSYYQQLGAFKSKRNALKFALTKEQEEVQNVGVVLHNGLYKVVVGYIQRSKNNGT